MILNLNDNWRVRTDRWNYILEFKYIPEKSSKEEPEATWRTDGGFHGTLTQAVLKAHRLNIMLDDAEGVQQVVDLMKQSEEALIAAIRQYEESKNKQ